MLVIIPDIHLDCAFVEKILRRHRNDGSTRLLLLGDYFDSRDTALADAGPRPICRLLNRLVADWGDRITLLLGNHDMAYLECFWENRVLSYPFSETTQYGTLDAEVILETLRPEVWSAMRLLHTEGRVVFTHAGFHAPAFRHWRESAVFRARMRRYAQNPRSAYKHKDPVIFSAGRLRGGSAPAGGILWQDWAEWTALAPAAPDPAGWWQVFGHTKGPARTHGNAVCLDGAQRLYATWDTSGLRVRDAATGVTMLTVEGFPDFRGK